MKGLVQSVAQVNESRRIQISTNLCRMKIELMAITGSCIEG